MADTRYPYTYACDLIRSKGGYGANGTKLSRSDASQIRKLFTEVLAISDTELANKLADYYLSNQKRITDESIRDFNSAQEYHRRQEAKHES